MEFLPDKRFFDEAQKFNLTFTCEDCAYQNPITKECVHGYPNEVHRKFYYQNLPPSLIPCKDFELI